jgi:hypothetical protein
MRRYFKIAFGSGFERGSRRGIHIGGTLTSLCRGRCSQ